MILNCLHLHILNRYKFKSSKRIRSHSSGFQDKNRVGISLKDSFQIPETEKLRKYDLLVNDVKIISYVMTRNGIMTKYHKSHLKRHQTLHNVETYIQSIVHKKTVEIISFDRRRGLELEPNAKRAVKVRQWVSQHFTLKEANNKKDSVLQLTSNNITPFISEGEATFEVPTINISEESDFKEEPVVLKKVEENI
ncbi:hypothetical protein CWI38_0125p0020 [Hamiltosporidium tvaerminnensis]|uniref:Uncharacterized protein n=1 Tax=Hamiltosporidium tvaerminnensis TaxID=1176355 RepID=A0A4Q9M1X4_9MICR|nr:hypothetical protein CWI38_0125p0020 [Hamiltosporidium tvaerminnensis]